MRRPIMLLTLLLAIVAINVVVQAKNPLEGVWKVSEITVTGNNGGTVSNPQPGLVIFGKKYFTMMYVPSDKERPIYAGAAPTAEEKVAAFDSFIANAGTYEIAGGKLTIKPTVARNPGFTGGGFATYAFRTHGNELWLTIKSSDFNFRVGDKILPLGGPASETTIKLVRLE